MGHPHLELLTRLDDAFNREDFDAVLALMTDDVELHVSGQSRMAGSHKGRGEIGSTIGLYMEALGEVQDMETVDVLANDRHGVQLQRVTARKGDRTISIDTVNVFRFAGDKVAEVWTLDFDQHAADSYYDS